MNGNSRRDFVKKTALLAVGTGLGFPNFSKNIDLRTEEGRFSGIQIAAHSFYDEGIEYCLDLLQGIGAINTLMVSFHAYYGAIGRSPDMMANHGILKPDNTKRSIRRSWIVHDSTKFKNTNLAHRETSPDEAYADKQIMIDLLDSAHKRGMKVYERLYEPHGYETKKYIKNFENVLELNMYGERSSLPCLNNPDFQEFLKATVDDLFSNYPLDGVQYGAERCSMLSSILHWNGSPCLCIYCRKRMIEKGLDPVQVKSGAIKLDKYLKELKNQKTVPLISAFSGYMKILMEHSDLLGFEREMHLSNNEIHKMLYDTVKSINPDAKFGRHIGQFEMMVDPLYRAGEPMEEMHRHCDFIKPITYHEIAGPRLKEWYVDIMAATLYKGMEPQEILDMFYSINGYNKQKEPKYSEIERLGLSPEYVYTEVKRIVDLVSAKNSVYAGIGLDIPKGKAWGDKPWQSNPQSIFEAVERALAAGASGVVACREYEEMSLASLRAFGDGVRIIK